MRNIADGKGENGGYQYFLLFDNVFNDMKDTVNIFRFTFNLSSANVFNSDKAIFFSVEKG